MKFNDKLYFNGEWVVVVSNKVSATAKKVNIEIPSTGKRVFIFINEALTLKQWQEQQQSKITEAVEIKEAAKVEEVREVPEVWEVKASINISDPQEFAAIVLALDEPEAIKEMCNKLCDRVFPVAGSHNPKSRSDKLNRLGYNRLFRNAENLVEGQNAFYQTKQDGSLWLRHLYFKYVGIADTNWSEINKQAAEKVKANLADQVVGLDIAKYEESVGLLLASDRIWEIGAGLIAASGRRPSEVAICGEFEVSGDGLMFSGQAKKRGNESEAYLIPLIGCTPELFSEKLKTFRDSPEVRRYADRDDLREATSPINTQINRLGIVPTFGWLPVPGQKSNPTCSDLRAAWVTIVEQKFKPEGKYSLLFRSEMLGHTLKVEGVAALNYSRYSLKEKPCSEPLNYSQELEASGSDLSPSENLNLQEPAKFQNQPEPSTKVIGPILQSSQTSEISEEALGILIPSSGEAPVKIYPAAENAPDLMENNLPSGGKCSELSPNADPVSWDGRMSREHCLAGLEKLLPASEWLATKLKAQSLFRQRDSELRTAANESLLLPTPTTYPKGSKPGISPAGRNSLETKLRSLLPTPRANDGSQGHNTGKTGGVNITGLLKRDRHLMPGEMANPQIWGWMMGFPENWCESVLMPDGLRILADLDGGSDRSPLPESASLAKTSPVGENQSLTTEPPASQLSASPLHSESSILPIAQESDEPEIEEKSRLTLPPEQIESGRKITAISLHQPWASLIASGHKRYETRSWPTSYRGPIAIHAAKKIEPDSRLLNLLGAAESDVPRGAVVAIADLVNCIQMDAHFIEAQSDTERMCGDWSVGRWAWELENIRAIEPISARGMQGLWQWEMDYPIESSAINPVSLDVDIMPIAQESDDTPAIEKSGSATTGRHEHDFYETPPWLTLLALANVPLSGKILEPCVGHRAIASILEVAGLEVASNDIDVAKPADFHLDATLPESWANFPAVDWVVTNPPYADLSAPIVKVAYAHAAKGIVMVLRQNWAEACEDRREFLAANPPTMQISVPRYCYRKGKEDKNGKRSWATDQCPTWIYVWDKANTSGLTKIITLWDDLIPLFHRTPDGIPSDEAIAAEVQRIAGIRSTAIKPEKDQSLAAIAATPIEQDKIDKLLEANQALGDGRFYVSQTLIKRLLKCRDQTANLLLRLNKGKIDILNKGINHTINRGREAELDKLISSLIS